MNYELVHYALIRTPAEAITSANKILFSLEGHVHTNLMWTPTTTDAVTRKVGEDITDLLINTTRQESTFMGDKVQGAQDVTKT